MKRTTCFLIGCLILYAANLLARDHKPAIEKQPLWVTPVSIAYTNTYLDKDAADGYSDLHYEQQVSLQQQAVFVRKAMHILSAAGVQNLSKVSVSYDPSFQQLSFHTIRIIRDNQVINQLELSRIKTIQQEKELSRNIYDGSLTAILILEDVRKDDIVEYSYTIKGFNPIFKNKYADVYSTRFGFPMYSIYYKLLVPKARAVAIKNSLTDIEPAVSSTATETIYEWKIKDQKALLVESDIPSWYDAFPMIMISEYKTWSEINQWALELFPFTTPLTAPMQKKINEIKAAYSSTEKQLLATLKFVQDDVRYMGIEMGENSHKPHPASQVFQQRFGDCKDKAYLLCTLLRALGIEANPVLNNTVYKKTINNWLPSPTAFDHTTVSVVLNGQTYWFDPTISYQRGALEQISYPNYQTGLVIKNGTTGFTPIALQNIGKIATKESFYVESLSRPVKLVVTTTFTGSFADNICYDFKSSSMKEIQDGYKKLYTSYFKKIEADSLTHEDDDSAGVLITKEYYTIGDFWKKEDGKQKVLLEPYLIGSLLKKPEAENREMPFALSYPARYTEDIEIYLPEDWPISESSHDFKTPGCSLNFSYSRPTPDFIRLHYAYESTNDHILPAATSEHLEQLSEAEEIIAFELSDDINKRTVSTALNSDSNNGFRIAYVILGICALGTYIYRSKYRRKNYWE